VTLLSTTTKQQTLPLRQHQTMGRRDIELQTNKVYGHDVVAADAEGPSTAHQISSGL